MCLLSSSVLIDVFHFYHLLLVVNDTSFNNFGPQCSHLYDGYYLPVAVSQHI